MNRIKIVLAGENTLTRKALAFLLRENKELEIVSETGNVEDLIQSLENKVSQVAVVELENESSHEQENLKKIFRFCPEAKIIVLGVNPERINKVLYKQIHAFILKNEDPETLFKAIYSSLNPEYHFMRSVYTRAVKQKRVIKPKPVEDKFTLNEKEKEILKYICDGKTNKEIASLFQLAPATVDFHRSKIYGKTKSNNVIDLFRYAVKQGFVTI